jgi:rhamnose transport system ATP-binding protein
MLTGMGPLVRLTSVSKSFGAVQALRGVSFELQPGEVHALVGENGAGKSTIVKIITGAHRADSGTVEIAGQVVRRHDPAVAKGLGIATIYQQPALFADLSVAENIALRLERDGLVRLVRWGRRRERAAELLDRVGARLAPDAFVRDLSMPEQQLVEIASAVGAAARILIFDEPTSSLSEREVENLFRVIGELRRQGVGSIYISHRLEELPRIADRVTVLRDGACVATHPMGAVDRAELIRQMVGRPVDAVFPKASVPLGEVVLETRGVSCAPAKVRDVSLRLRAGEILGLAGLVGAGRTELARVLFGLAPADAGQILVRGRSVTIGSPDQAIRQGIAYVPEDRRRHGVILEMPVAANTTLAILRRLATGGMLRFGEERRVAGAFVERLGIRTASLDAPAGNLSGGNQQKVALARWLATEPSVIILDEPTQGVDVGAKAEIHRLMGELAGRGMAILMISSELPEVLGMSDRIAVMHQGRIAGTLDRAEATQDRVLAMALGHREEGAA